MGTFCATLACLSVQRQRGLAVRPIVLRRGFSRTAGAATYIERAQPGHIDRLEYTLEYAEA